MNPLQEAQPPVAAQREPPSSRTHEPPLARADQGLGVQGAAVGH